MSAFSTYQQLIAFVEEYLQVEYSIVAAAVVVVYDYLLSIPLEVEFVWNRKRSTTTFVYITLRYLGLAYATSAIPGYLTTNPLSTQGCTALFWLNEIILIIVMVLLQAMMTLRVYVLLGKPRKLLPILVVCLMAVQGLNIISTSVLLKVANNIADVGLANAWVCGAEIPSTVSWVYPTSSIALMTHEIMLCVLGIFHAVKHIEGSFWKNPMASVNNIMVVIVRDNLIYFFITMFSMIITSLSMIQTLNNSVSFQILEGILHTAMYSLVGPWMLISLRESYERSLNSPSSNSHELTTVEFAGHNPRTLQSEGEA